MGRALVSRGRVAAGLAVLSLGWPAAVRAQLVLPKDGEKLPSFEVATIKPATDPRGSRWQWMPDGCRMDNVPLSWIIGNAYGAASDEQLVGGPGALLDRHFDVQAKMDEEDAAQLKGLSREESRRRMDLMMQALLRDRFQLKMHVETREMTVYALVVAKGGPKLEAAQAGPAPAPEDGGRLPDQLPSHLPHRAPPGSTMMQMSATRAEMSVSGGTMKQLAEMLTGQEETEGRVVIDKTGLTGKYDWYLEWTPAGAAMGMKGDDGRPAEADAPGLFTALEEELGLRLESGKGPVQVVVIDHVEAPSAN